MAATDARPVPRKNAAYRVYFTILDADGDPVSGAAALDSEVSKDGAAFADCTNEATEIGSTGFYFLDLTATEMDADAVIVRIQTSTTEAKTTPIILYPEEAGDIRVNVTQVSDDATAADNLELAYDGTGYAGGTTLQNVNATQISGDATAADNAEAFFDGTGYAGTNNVIPTVTSVTNIVTANTTQISGDATAADNLESEYDGTGFKSYVRRGTAQAGAAGSITLDASASATNDLFNGLVVSIVGGTGAGQARLATDYVGATKVLSVTPNWTTTPSSDSVFVLSPMGQVDLALWLGTAPSALQSGRVDSHMGAAASAVIAAATFAAGAIDAAAIATGAIDADALATDAANEIRDAVWAEAMSELASVPGVTGTMQEALQWLFLLGRNKITQTSTTQTLRNDADSATIATAGVSDNGTTFERAEWS